MWTGSNNNGTEKSNSALGRSQVQVGALSCSSLNPLSSPNGGRSTSSFLSKQFYALSPVIKLIDEVAVQGVSIESSPTNATSGYAAGETIRVRLDFDEAVTVTDSPYVVLNIGRTVRRAEYASGSGTRHLDFEYTVQAADFDSDGISLCSDTFLDRGCGRISLDGGRILAQSDSLAVELDLPAFGAQSGHKVDGMPEVFTPNPGVGPMANPGMGEVPLDWALKPASISRGQPFRLLFVSFSRRDAASNAVADYNRHVIDAAGGGIPRSGSSRTASGPSSAPRRWMRGTTPGSPGPGCRSTG